MAIRHGTLEQAKVWPIHQVFALWNVSSAMMKSRVKSEESDV
jgi:hypothetical protein